MKSTHIGICEFNYHKTLTCELKFYIITLDG
nr:MAG TPA: hypothetical protein [Caudoviricetes sp.]